MTHQKKSRRKKGHTGISLAETTIALTLLGVVLVPILMMSSSWFARSMVQDRDNITVSYEISQFLNRLASELSHTTRLLSTSTSTDLRFAYYDPLQQTEVYRGYRLTANGSSLQLERMVYNSSTGAWVAQSPYGENPASAVLVNSGATFDYCAGSNCAVSAVRAFAVRLNGWQFTSNGAQRRSLTLPAVQLYLSAEPQPLVSEQPRLLFSLPLSQMVDSNAVRQALSYSPLGSKLLTHVADQSASGGLTTLLTNHTLPGVQNTIVDSSTGRAFFGDNDLSAYAIPKNFYTWSPTTGLSTLIGGDPNAYGASRSSLAYDAVNQRIFVGYHGNWWGSMYTWASATGLSTLVYGSSCGAAATNAIAVSTSTGRVFWGEACNPGRMFTWRQSTGLSTIGSAFRLPAYNNRIAVDPGNDRVFFGEEHASAGRVFTWQATTGLSTLLVARNNPGGPPIVIDTLNNRAFWGESNSSGRFYSWHATTGLSTLLFNRALPGVHSAAVAPTTGRVFFGQEANPGHLYTWHSTTGLSTLVASRVAPGWQSMVVDPTREAVFFADDYLGNAGFYWSSANGLSTVATFNVQSNSIFQNPTTNQWFLVDRGNYGIYTWTPGGSLSTIFYSPACSPAGGDDWIYKNMGLSSNTTPNRLFFRCANSIITWSATTGVSTLLVSANQFSNSLAVNSNTGQAFFGENSEPGNFYIWTPPTPGSGLLTLNMFAPVGRDTPTYIVAGPSGATYVAWGIAPDSAILLFGLNTANNTVDGYRLASTGSSFSLNNQMSYNSWTASVGAMAIDASGFGVALLDTGNKQIDVYGDRTLNGTPAAPTQLSISGTTTPTGLAQSARTGNYLVLDSALQSSTNVRLFVYNSGGTLQQTININVTAGNLGVAATSETNFKIQYNEKDNILYLVAPNINSGTVFALSLPRYL